ncbi:MAG: alpha/beta fold hydrolase [Nocardioidaceae bacterium]|nr:alpha/beta fold hydrolase [Nocardioidaceae bacterium]
MSKTGVSAEQIVVESEGLRLAAWQGPGTGPTVAFVHGFPDTHAVWQPVVERLADRFRCVTYDVRGAGASDSPSTREGYHVSHLVTDLVAVVDACAPAEPVHLVGHDWGSVQSWEAVFAESSDPRLEGRIASYTSISGPALAHMAAFAKTARDGDWRHRQEWLVQQLHSWYVYAFQLPLLPELALRTRATRQLAASRKAGRTWPAATLAADTVHGLELYRANLRGDARSLRPGGVRQGQRARTRLPVQLVVPLRDPYITPAATREVHRFVPNLTRVKIDAGHWVQQTDPDRVAALIGDFASAHRAIAS